MGNSISFYLIVTSDKIKKIKIKYIIKLHLIFVVDKTANQYTLT